MIILCLSLCIVGKKKSVHGLYSSLHELNLFSGYSRTLVSVAQSSAIDITNNELSFSLTKGLLSEDWNQKNVVNAIPKREVICVDTSSWLESIRLKNYPLGTSIFTSLPDISELSSIYNSGPNLKLDLYKNWFINTVSSMMSKLPINGYIILLQSDARILDKDGKLIEWLDKSYLCSKAAEQQNCVLQWHKLTLSSLSSLTKPSSARPTYSHLLCYRKKNIITSIEDQNLVYNRNSSGGATDNNFPNQYSKDNDNYQSNSFAIPDIILRGEMIWPKAIGINCAIEGVKFLKDIAKSSLIIDPFCGYGTILAVANYHHISALGIEISPKRCKKAETLDVSLQILGNLKSTKSASKMLHNITSNSNPVTS